MGRPTAKVALATAAAFALIGPRCLQAIWDSDAGWHLAVGRLVRATGVPHTNALAFTARDAPWYATNWLFDWLAAALDARLGPLGLQLLIAALLLCALAAWAVALQLADPDGPWLLPLGALLLLPRLTHRPHVATWAALAAVLALCLAGRGRKTIYRLACVPVLVLAGNLHAGAAFAAAVAGLFCLEELLRTRRAAELLTALACGVSLLMNPGALYNLGYLVSSLRMPELVKINELLPASPWREPLFFAVLPAALVLGVWRRREAGYALLASFALLAALGLRANRLTYDSFLPALPLLALGLSPLRARLGRRAAVLSALLLTLVCAAVVDAPGRLLPPRPSASFDASVLAVRAAGFARAAGLTGRRFNSMSDGGYLEYALPDSPSFADGRLQAYPDSFWRDFQEAEKSGAAFRGWLDQLKVEWAITLRLRERLGGHRLLNAPDWALIYWDQVSEVWVRRALPRFQPLIAQLEYRYFRPYGSIVGAVEKTPRAELAAFAAEIDRFERTSPGDQFALLVRCALAARGGDLRGREAFCGAAWESGVPAVRALAGKAKSVKAAE